MWSTLYMILCTVNSKKSAEWNNRLVTGVHGILITVMAFYGAFIIGPWPFTDAGGPNNYFHVQTVNLSLAYFLFDIVWCLYYNTEGPVMLAHHSLSILGMAVCLIRGRYGTEMVATIAGAEVTSPLLQLRWFLKQSGKLHGWLADGLELLFLLTFGLVRIGVGGNLLYCYYQQDTDTFGRLGGTGMYIISVIFFYQISVYTVKKYMKRLRSSPEKINGHGNNVLNHSCNGNGNAKENGKDILSFDNTSCATDATKIKEE